MATPRPWNENGHAIVQAAFSVDFASPPVPSTIRDALSLHPRIRSRYPRKQEIRTIPIPAVPVPAQEGPVEVQSVAAEESRLGGFTFDSLKPDGAIERSITLIDNKLSVMRADYKSWDKTWGEVRELFSLMLPVLLERTAVIGFHLEYHDRFVWDSERDRFRPEAVFRTGSQWLTPNVFEAEDLWHSHHGFFIYRNQPCKHQLLNVLEAQLIPIEDTLGGSGSALAADVRSKHRVVHGVVRTGGSPEEISSVEAVFGKEGKVGLFDTYMCEMHDQNKSILAQSINDEMCDRIRLDRPK